MKLLRRLKDLLLGNRTPPPEPTPAEREARYLSMLQFERTQKDLEFRQSPYSPIPTESRSSFDGLNYYPPDPNFRFTITLIEADPEKVTITTNDGTDQPFYRVGHIQFEVEGESVQLAVYQDEEQNGYFLPFRDVTSGQETYGAGRYLEPVHVGQGQLLVDFNLAYNPYCAYSPDYSCPIPPRENWLKVPIQAGEKQFTQKAPEHRET